MKPLRVFFFAMAAFFAAGSARAGETCDSPRVLSKLFDQVRALGFSNPDWMVRMHLMVPYFRMKDVEISAVSVNAKGPSRTGLDCEASLKMIPPAEFRSDAPTVVGHFGYVILSKSNGDFDLDLY